MESQCSFCEGHQWVEVRVDPVPPWSDFLSVDQDAQACYLCNLDGSVPYPWDSEESFPYYFAQAIGGFEGQYGLFQRFVDGQLLRSVLVDRSLANYSSWQPPLPIEDCPVCLGWGVWSNNGNIRDCIACGGQPIEARQGFQPLYAWWLRKISRGAIYMQRGRPESTPLSTEEIIYVLETTPGVTRVG